MLYALLCYADEILVNAGALDEAEASREVVTPPRSRRPLLRLLPSSATLTVRRSDPPLIVDGPLRDNRVQLLAIDLIEAGNLEAALELVVALGADRRDWIFELRPLSEPPLA